MFFDPILHLTPSTVNVVVKPLGATFQIGDHVTRIGTPLVVFGLGDDAPLLVPSLGLVLELSEESHFAAASVCLRSARFCSLAERALSRSFLANPTM